MDALRTKGYSIEAISGDEGRVSGIVIEVR
jgi:hypothetical protein